MKYHRLGASSLMVSELTFGCMSLGDDYTANERLLRQAFDGGITCFDTADLYQRGQNEVHVGRALAPLRQSVVIATKVGNQWRPDGSGWDWNPSGAYIRQAVQDSLRRLGTDYIDLYQLHGGTIDDPIDEVIETFESLQAAGYIRAWGISSIRPNVIRAYAARARIASVMMQYSLLDRRPEESCLPLLADAGISVIVRGALARGSLAGKPAAPFLTHDTDTVAAVQQALADLHPAISPGHAAIRFAQAAPAVATLAVGISTSAQLIANLAAIDSPALTPDQLGTLAAIAPRTYYTDHR
ncbi:MAG: aldo/keto reductase [Bacteroidia bacterium]